MNSKTEKWFLMLRVVAFGLILTAFCYEDKAADNRVTSEGGVSAESSKTIRLALGGFAGTSEGQGGQPGPERLLDLLTVKLSSLPGIELVERHEMDRLLKEMILAANQSSAQKAVRAGQLLRADLLLMGNWLRTETNNLIAARLVDARTGIILDFMTKSFLDSQIESVTESIAGFVRLRPSAPAKGPQWTLLGLGGFENLGVNDRHSDLRQQLRLALDAAFQGTSIRTVERAMVSPLLNEFRLAQSGLAADSNLEPNAAPAFVLLDGVYQGLQEETAKVNLVMRVQKIGGAQRLLSFKAPPSAEFNAKVVAGITKALEELKSTGNSSNRLAEAQTQLARGKERARLPRSLVVHTELGGYWASEEREKRLSNINEAIEAFQTVLLLDPDCVEAKLFLAACYLDPYILKRDAARDLLAEVIATGNDVMIPYQWIYKGAKQQSAKFFARWRLAYSYKEENDALALEMFRGIARDVSGTPEAEHFRLEIRDTMENLLRANKITSREIADFDTDCIWSKCEAANKRIEAGQIFDGWNQWRDYCTEILRDYLFDSTQAQQYMLANFCPVLQRKWPRLAPFVEACFITQFPQPPPKMLADLKANLGIGTGKLVIPFRLPVVEEKTVTALSLANCSPDFLSYIMTWALNHKEYELVEKTASSLTVDSRSTLYTTALVHLGFAYREQGKWQEALQVFEQMAQRVSGAMAMNRDGPWGRANSSHVVPEKLAQECRRQLELNSEQTSPETIELGTPVLTFAEPVVLASDGPNLWIADGIVPCLYNKATQTLTVPEDGLTNDYSITTICVGKSRVWFGTANGLLEFDPKQKKWHRYAEHDGLLLPRITALAEGAERLWIGYGKVDRGALGYMDLKTHIFSAYSQDFELLPATNDLTALRPQDYDFFRTQRPPRNRVVGLALPREDEVWLGVRYRGVVRHLPARNQWKFMLDMNIRDLSCMVGNSRYIACGSMGDGGIICNELATGRLLTPQLTTEVPNALVSALALDGPRLWIGGTGWLAALDLNTGKIVSTRIIAKAELDFETPRSARVTAMAVDEDAVWVELGANLHRIPKK